MKTNIWIFSILGLSLGSCPTTNKGFVAPPLKKGIRSNTPFLPLKEGVYKIINPPRGAECASEAYLRVKQYLPKKYYLSLDRFSADGTINRSCCPPGASIYVVALDSIHTSLLWSASQFGCDSLQFRWEQDSILEMKTWSAHKGTPQEALFQWEHVQSRATVMRDYDGYHGYYFIPQFSNAVKIRGYDYPDTTCPKIISLFKKEDVLVRRWVDNALKERFYFVYFGLIRESNTMYYEDYKYHLWIKAEDLLQYFTLDKMGHL
jgi:hypothetical protein